MGKDRKIFLKPASSALQIKLRVHASTLSESPNNKNMSGSLIKKHKCHYWVKFGFEFRVIVTSLRRYLFLPNRTESFG